MFKKALSPVIATIILASASLIIGIAILSWLSSHSSFTIKESQIEAIRAELAAEENIVPIHAYYDENDKVLKIYIANMGFKLAYIGPIRLYNSTANLVFVPYGITNDNYYTLLENETTNVNSMWKPIGFLSEFLESLKLTTPDALPKTDSGTYIMSYFPIKPYNPSETWYLIEIPIQNLSSGNYVVEIWSVVLIYDKVYINKPYLILFTK